MLTAFLDYYRASLLLKLEGLDDAEARTASVPPSILTLTGLVRHMSEVERAWFQRWMLDADAPPIYYTDERPDGDLEVGSDDTIADAVAVWQAEVDIARTVTSGAGLDDLSARAGTTGHWEGFHPSLRWIMVHMIEEYARHCGHADLIRECIDGVTGD